MKNEIEIISQDIDWKKVIELVLNRQDWGKIYTLYKSGTTVITCCMDTFNFPNNTATFLLGCAYIHNGELFKSSLFGNHKEVEYRLKNFTIDFFKHYMNKRIVTLMNDIQASVLKYRAEEEYRKIHYYSWDINIEKFSKKYDYEDELNYINSIKKEDFKDSCLEELRMCLTRLSNKQYDEKVKNYINNNSIVISGFEDILSFLDAKIKEQDEKEGDENND